MLIVDQPFTIGSQFLIGQSQLLFRVDQLVFDLVIVALEILNLGELDSILLGERTVLRLDGRQLAVGAELATGRAEESRERNRAK